MAKKKQNDSNSIYYFVRVLQRVSLLIAAAFTIILWAMMISISYSQTLLFSDVLKSNLDANFNSPRLVELHEGWTDDINNIKNIAVTFSVIAIIVTSLLYLIPRVKKFEKRLIVDGLVISIICLIFANWHMSIFTKILSNI